MKKHGLLPLVLLLAGAVSAASQSGDAILRKSVDAYAALTSYEGDTRASGSAPSAGVQQPLEATARITFARPGKLRIIGYVTSKQAYAIVSDGKATWIAETDRNGGAYEKAPDLEQAFAALAGSTLSAPAIIPALLMRLPGGDPFRGVAGSRIEGHETIDGKECYRVVGTSGGVQRTFWIDSSSFWLRQMTERPAAPSQAGAGSPAALSQRVYRFSLRQTNQPIAEKLFQQPSRPLDLLSIPSGGGRILEK